MSIPKIEIDKTLSIPLADQIYNDVLIKILNGDIKPGAKLPTERELAETLNLSRGTIQRAYRKLYDANAIEIRKGSGSYVLKNEQVVEENQKKDALHMIEDTLFRLRSLGLSEKEILNLMHLRVGADHSIRKVMIMVISNNYQILSELENQLSYLTAASHMSYTLSFLTIACIKGAAEPVQMLRDYDLIISTPIDYEEIVSLVPIYAHRIVKVNLAPHTNTLLAIANIPRHHRIRVIFRTIIFRDFVLTTLYSLGFSKEQIDTVHEDAYRPISHFENNVQVVINFNESPVYVDDFFQTLNQEFESQGGQLLRFIYRIDRGSLSYIEDRLNALLLAE